MILVLAVVEGEGWRSRVAQLVARVRVVGAHGTEGGCRLRDRKRLSRPRGATAPGASGRLRVRPPA